MLKLFKILLIIFNFLFVLCGGCLIGIGIWTAVDKIYVSSIIGDTLFSAASYMLICTGIIVFIVSIIAVFIVIKENVMWLKMYFVMLIFLILFLITAAVLAVVFKGEVEDVMVDSMRDSLVENYGKDSEITKSWDQLQKDLKCCAISTTVLGVNPYARYEYKDKTIPTSDNELSLQDSFPIYKRTKWYEEQLDVGKNDRAYVPASCCKREGGDVINLKYCQYFPTGPPFNYEGGLTNDYLNEQGCYSKAKTLILDQSDILVAIGFVFAFVMIGGVLLTFLLLRALSSEEEMEVKRRRQPDNL